MTKLCVDCKHHELIEYSMGNISGEQSVCNLFKPKDEIDIVDGEVKTFSSPSCVRMRYGPRCGKNGFYYEFNDGTPPMSKNLRVISNTIRWFLAIGIGVGIGIMSNYIMSYLYWKFW